MRQAQKNMHVSNSNQSWQLHATHICKSWVPMASPSFFLFKLGNRLPWVAIATPESEAETIRLSIINMTRC